MSIFDEKRAELEQHEFMMGVERARGGGVVARIRIEIGESGTEY
jgi:hypothetical protein